MMRPIDAWVALLWISRKYSWKLKLSVSSWNSQLNVSYIPNISGSGICILVWFEGQVLHTWNAIQIRLLYLFVKFASKATHSFSFQYLEIGHWFMLNFGKQFRLVDYNGLTSLFQAIWKYCFPCPYPTSMQQKKNLRKWKSIFPIDWTFSEFDKIRLISLHIERPFWKFR